MKKILTLFGLILLGFSAAAQTGKFIVGGTVTEKRTGASVAGAVISSGERSKSTITDELGKFSLMLDSGEYTLTASFLGFETFETELALFQDMKLDIALEDKSTDLGEVVVMSTGYQQIPRERATGSFVSLDNELVNRRVSTNLIDRLEDVTSGVIFNKTGPANDPISIRGRNTIFANTQPLIIIDNFPYDGPLENINPNDVASITVLRDAAAASIWGARSGNGVIVINTKRGMETPLRLTFNSTVNVLEKPDLFYAPKISVDDFMDVERMLFDRNYYLASENSINRIPLSPGVEALIQARDGLISGDELAQTLAGFRSRDSRRELMDHFYRPAVNQQYSVQLSGGTANFDYSVSAGIDRNLENIHANSNSRYTLSNRNNWKLLKGKMILGTGFYFTKGERLTGTVIPEVEFPYERFLDDAGVPLPITKQYSRRFVDNLGQSGLLDWNYTPLNEIGASNDRRTQDDIRININLGYEVAKGLKLEGFYQYWSNNQSNENLQTTALFSTRDLINRFTQEGVDGNHDYPVPVGSILDQERSSSFSHNLRGQISFNRTMGERHRIDAVAGLEVKDHQFSSRSFRFYGYRENLGISTPVDFVNSYRMYHNGSLLPITDGVRHRGSIDRFVSQYMNMAYTFKDRYNLSLSARRDASNLFGVESNRKAVPLWSAGIGWIVSEEKFLDMEWLPYLRLRATYGKNGNVDKSVSALTTATYFTNNILMVSAGETAALISSPENRSLRWEKINVFNVGLDFETENGRVKGQLEAYLKTGTDLIGNSPYIPSSGFSVFRTNSASTKTQGLDLDLQTLNLRRSITWTTNFLLSTIDEKITDYFFESTPNLYLQQPLSQLLPLEGRPLFAMYSLPWAGLNPDTGAPRGFLDGEASENYSGIFARLTTDNLQYHGPRRPSVFGAIRNSFSYNNFSLSVNLSYRLGYYYRRESVFYNLVLTGKGGHADFGQRWMQPGDELVTQVPSMPTSSSLPRDNMYRYSDLLVERGDHVRLQDIRLSYRLGSAEGRTYPFSNLEIYSYANNLGIIWKKSKDPVDPDYRELLPPRSLAFGLNITF